MRSSGATTHINPNFSRWSRWEDRKPPKCPGVYAIAISNKDIASQEFSWMPEIAYFGMTVAKGGLRSRLKQFDNTIRGSRGHGGAFRFRYKHPKYEVLKTRLYVAATSVTCDVCSKKPKPADLRLMGDVCKLEYECQAIFVEKFNRLPEFNDKERSPKK